MNGEPAKEVACEQCGGRGWCKMPLPVLLDGPGWITNGVWGLRVRYTAPGPEYILLDVAAFQPMTLMLDVGAADRLCEALCTALDEGVGVPVRSLGQRIKHAVMILLGSEG